MIQRSQHNCVQVCSSQHNAHPVHMHMPSNMHVPCLQVMAFSNRKEADDFIQSRQKYVLGAVHFVDSPSKQLQYIIQSNTSVSIWEDIQAPHQLSCCQHASSGKRSAAAVHGCQLQLSCRCCARFAQRSMHGSTLLLLTKGCTPFMPCRRHTSKAMCRAQMTSSRCHSCRPLHEKSAGTTWKQQEGAQRQPHSHGSRSSQHFRIPSCRLATQATSCRPSSLWLVCSPPSASWAWWCLRRNLGCGRRFRPWACSRARTGSAGGYLRH